MWHAGPMPTLSNARRLARDAVMADIVEEGRRQLAEVGPTALSLRAVARQLGMASSAVYRYVASRDDLLTRLIVAAYDELATAVDTAVRPADPPRRRFLAAADAVRSWAAEHPHDYALLYGSPVPGYAAPDDTIVPATRIYRSLIEPVATVDPRPGWSVPDGSLAHDVVRMHAALGIEAAPATTARALGAVATIIGLVSLERFGHLTNVVTDRDAWFADRAAALADDLAL